MGGATFDDAAAVAAVTLQKDGSSTDLAGVGQVTINADKTEITIAPTNALAPGRYTVKLLANQVQDEQGNAITTEQSAVFVVDTALPTVTFSPANGTRTGNVDVNVEVEFNEAVRKANGDEITNLNAHDLVTLKKDGGGADLAGSRDEVSINADKTVITINPASSLVPGSYTVTLLANSVQDEAGNDLAALQSATFVVDPTAPTVTFSPADGDKTGNVNVNVKVEFNEAVQKVGGATFDDAAAVAAVTLQKDGSSTDLAGSSSEVSINNAKTEITIAPASSLVPGSYTVTLLANQVQDEQGNAITTEQSATFVVDPTAPTVTFSPADGDKTGNVNVNVKVEFNEAVQKVGGATFDDAAAVAAVTLQKDGSSTDLAGSSSEVSINNAKTEITIAPTNALAPGRYTVKLLANQVQDEQGNAITTEQSAVFVVDTALPTVTFSPANGTRTGNVDVNVEVEFNEAVRKANGDEITNLNAHDLVTLKKDGGGADLAGSRDEVSINADKTVITINPASSLVPGSYTVTLLANSVQDEAGNDLAALQSATFVVDPTAPTVTFSPADGDKTGNVNVNVKVEFNEAVQKVGGATFDDAAAVAVTLQKDGSSTDLAGSSSEVSINNAKTEITIAPASSLVPGSYTVTLLANQVQDEQGNAITTEQSATFVVDPTAPTVTFSPADGDKTGNVNVNVKVEFNEAVQKVGGATFDDAAAVAAVTLQKDGSSTDLAGSSSEVSINNAKTEITIAPASSLAPGRYTVKLLANQVQDEQGNAITTEQSATFVVDPTAPTVTFSPADGDKTGNVNVNVKVEFNEAVQKVGGATFDDAAAVAAVTLQKDGSSTDLAGSSSEVSINNAKTEITIAPASSLVPGRYTVKLLANQVQDELGNAITTEQSATFVVDPTAPTVTFSPADGDKTGNVNVNVKVEFNEAVQKVGGATFDDAAAVAAVTLQKDGSSTDLAGSSSEVSINNAKTEITIAPASSLAPGRYTVKLLANQVQDEQGNAITTEQSATFVVDPTAPTVAPPVG